MIYFTYYKFTSHNSKSLKKKKGFKSPTIMITIIIIFVIPV